MNKEKKISEKDLYLLKNVVDILRQFNVTFWLDQGSLLGVVRDGEFLPWDHDIDLGVWATTIEQHVPEIVKKLRLLGARVDVHSHKISVAFGTWRATGKPVELRIYHIKSNDACSILTSGRRRYIPSWCHYVFHCPIAINKCFGHLLIQLSKRLCFRNILYIVGAFFYDCGSNLQEYLRGRRVLFCCPKTFFLALVEHSIYKDIPVYIPEKTESYLAFKYGDDWRTPKKDWKYWEDDGALVKATRT